MQDEKGAPETRVVLVHAVAAAARDLRDVSAVVLGQFSVARVAPCGESSCDESDHDAGCRRATAARSSENAHRSTVIVIGTVLDRVNRLARRTGDITCASETDRLFPHGDQPSRTKNERLAINQFSIFPLCTRISGFRSARDHSCRLVLR